MRQKLLDFYRNDIEKIKIDLGLRYLSIYIDFVNKAGSEGRAYPCLPNRFKGRYDYYIQVSRTYCFLGMTSKETEKDDLEYARKILMHELRHIWQFHTQAECWKDKWFDPVLRKLPHEEQPWEIDCDNYEEQYNRLFCS